jgi:hypothetical protein
MQCWVGRRIRDCRFILSCGLGVGRQQIKGSRVKVSGIFFGLQGRLIRRCPACEKQIRRILSVMISAETLPAIDNQTLESLGLGPCEIVTISRRSYLDPRGLYKVFIDMNGCGGQFAFLLRGNRAYFLYVTC